MYGAPDLDDEDGAVPDPNTLPLTRIANIAGDPVDPGGGGGGAGTQAAPGYTRVVSDTAGTEPIGAPANAAYTDSTGAAAGGLIAILKGLFTRTPALTRARLSQGTAAITAASTPLAANNANPIVNANAVTLMAADAAVKRRRVQNLGTATIYVRFNPAGDTTPAFIPAASGAGAVNVKDIVALAAGATWETPVDEDATGLVSACSATANQTVSFSAT